MKHYGIDVSAERRSTLPVWDIEYESKFIYSETTDTLYYGSDTGWVTVSGGGGGGTSSHSALTELDYASANHTGFSPTVHSHTESNISDLDKYTQAEVDSLITTISGKLDDHNELNNLDYASAGHTGFQPAGEYATDSELISTSGTLQTDIDTRAVSGGAEHDNFNDFVANEHIDHSAVSITTGTGLIGGGDITQSRALDVDVGITDDKIVQIDDLDAASGDYCKLTASGIEGRSVSETFNDVKQDATENATGVLEKATIAEVVTGTDTDRAVTPAGITARMEAPGEIGGTTPAAGVFTTVKATTPDADALTLGDATAEGGDIAVYRDTSGNKQLTLDADAASNEKALDVYGGVLAQNGLTIGQTTYELGYDLYVNGEARITGTHTGGQFRVTTVNGFYADNNLSILPLNLPLTTSSGTHTVSMQITGDNILAVQATGDGAGGITNPKAIAVQPLHITAPADADALIMGGTTTESGDVSIYRDASGNKQIAIDADAASNTKALDVYGGVVAQNYLTIGQSTLNTAASLYVHGPVAFSTTVSLVGGNFVVSGREIRGYNNAPDINYNIPITSPNATDHAVKLQINSTDILTVQATGDGAGGIVEASKEVEVTGQLQGNLINNQMVQKATFDILGLMTDPRFLNLQCEDPGAGTMTDVSGQGHDGTYQGSMTTGDRVKKGMGWAVDFDGTNDYVNLGDSDDFSFGDGTNDEAVTWFGVVEVVDVAGSQVVISKLDETTGIEQREYRLDITSAQKIRLIQFDESVGVACSKIIDGALSIGYHSFVVTSPGDGGATAMNNVKIYIDGVLVASTATNDGAYVAMENLATPCWIGSLESTDGNPVFFMNGDNALTGMDGAEWSAMDVHRFHQLCKGLYAL